MEYRRLAKNTIPEFCALTAHHRRVPLTKVVGSVALTAIMQVAGAIAGAFIGIWLVGDYASTLLWPYAGFIVGMGIATVVGRLIWPVLPQMVMRNVPLLLR